MWCYCTGKKDEKNFKKQSKFYRKTDAGPIYLLAKSMIVHSKLKKVEA